MTETVSKRACAAEVLALKPTESFAATAGGMGMSVAAIAVEAGMWSNKFF
ncbi:hypothetical protein ACAF76_021460 [Brevibacillus sp. TJ4]